MHAVQVVSKCRLSVCSDSHSHPATIYEPDPVGSNPELQIVASTASTLEEPSLILVNKLPIDIASILLASNCLRNREQQFETLLTDTNENSALKSNA